jgi:hypothetical protein
MLSILYSLFVYKLLTVAITSEYIVNILYSMINTHNHADYSKQWCCLGRTSLVYCHERRIDTLLQNQIGLCFLFLQAAVGFSKIKKT